MWTLRSWKCTRCRWHSNPNMVLYAPAFQDQPTKKCTNCLRNVMIITIIWEWKFIIINIEQVGQNPFKMNESSVFRPSKSKTFKNLPFHTTSNLQLTAEELLGSISLELWGRRSRRWELAIVKWTHQHYDTHRINNYHLIAFDNHHHTIFFFLTKQINK